MSASTSSSSNPRTVVAAPNSSLPPFIWHRKDSHETCWYGNNFSDKLTPPRLSIKVAFFDLEQTLVCPLDGGKRYRTTNPYERQDWKFKWNRVQQKIKSVYDDHGGVPLWPWTDGWSPGGKVSRLTNSWTDRYNIVILTNQANGTEKTKERIKHIAFELGVPLQVFAATQLTRWVFRSFPLPIPSASPDALYLSVLF